MSCPEAEALCLHKLERKTHRRNRSQKRGFLRATACLASKGRWGWAGITNTLGDADIMRGTGRYNLALGAIATAQGIGASLSGLADGEIVDHFGYSAAFLALGAAAGVALIVFALRMPETAGPETVSLPSRQTDSG
jgi:hypothetical protein